MNLAWIAAVLRPLDVAPHPNFRSEIISDVATVAAIIIGDPSRLHQVHGYGGDVHSGPVDPTLRAVQNAVSLEHQEAGIRALATEIVAGHPSDAARSCALALITCASAAELDDYDTCFSVLEHQLKFARRSRGADHRLIEAILTQQLCLRQRDAGKPHAEDSLRVVSLLENFDASLCSKFELGPGVSWSSTVTLERIAQAVYDAALSLLPLTQPTEKMLDVKDLPTWQDRVRSEPVQRLLEIAANERDIYERYVARLFTDRYQGQTRTIISEAPPDLFGPTLQLELLAHGTVYSARRELAELRFLQADTQQFDDVLRLLRHAGASRELDMALRSMREAGPLEALSKDARRILSSRTQLDQLRSVELAVLAAAAELLSPAEARPALDRVLKLLRSGGPADLPGQWQIQPLRLESAWMAAVALAHAAGQSTDVAQALLSDVGAVNVGDELLDRALARAAGSLRWSEVDASAVAAWRRWAEASDTLMPITREVVTSQLDPDQLFVVSEDPDLPETASALNAILRGLPVDRSSLARSLEPVRERLRQIHAAAASGRFDFGGMVASDVAAGLVLYGGQDALWPDLAEFLMDNQVARDDRAPALERLSKDGTELPSDIRQQFSDASESLLHSDDRMFSNAIDPFPAALRFLGMFNCISHEEAFDLAAQLAGSSHLEKRREAGRTLAIWSRRLTAPWLAALAIQLSHDDDVQVRAHAGQVLARLAVFENSFQRQALTRLLELLNQDGLVIPLLTLHQLRELQPPLPNAIVQVAMRLQEYHPSLDVRLTARKVAEQAA